MSVALAFGFFHHITPSKEFDFERLHIFLFNLVSGGTLLLFYTEGKRELSRRGRVFVCIALLFTVVAFFECYLSALFLAFILALLVNFIRVKYFGSLLPKSIFTGEETVSRKFHQAALLCLTLALFLSVFAILNSEFFHWFSLEKLTLNTFFLGFSFPVSLISMSVIFSLIKEDITKPLAALKEFSFWAINLGVILFFIFILGGWFMPQVFIASFLFFSVGGILFLLCKEGELLQEKAFLLSAMLFLVATSLSGIAYIFLEFSDYYQPQYSEPLLRLHVFTSLYGWNLGGMVVIARNGEFPIALHTKKVIILHWLTVLVFCPLGYFFAPFAVIAVVFYVVLLRILFFADGR